MKDALTNWREIADGNLTATETSAAIEIGPAPIGGHKVAIHLPVAPNAAGDGLAITFTQCATFGGSYTLFHPIATLTGATITPDDLGVLLNNTQAFVKCVMTVTGATPNWGAVSAGLDEGYRKNVLTLGD